MSRQSDELALWQKWKDDPTPENMSPVLDSLQPVVNGRLRDFYGAYGAVPRPAVEGYANALATSAIKTYDPSMGASLGTWTSTQLRKVQSFVRKFQNLAYIPPGRAGDITPFKEGVEKLRARHGRSPSDKELAIELNWSVAGVTRMRKEQRKELIGSLMTAPPEHVQQEQARDALLLRNIVYELNQQEKFVYEHGLGINGKRKLTAGQMSQQLGVSASKISRIRASIRKKVDKAIGDK